MTLIIATKAGYGRGRAGQWIPDGRPETIRRHVERSLELLRLDRIHLLQLHTIDPKVALEESVGAMADLQGEGKVRMIGVSNFDVDELQRARAVGEIVTVQNRYSLGDRRSEDVLEVCERDGIAFPAVVPARRRGPRSRQRAPGRGPRPRRDRRTGGSGMALGAISGDAAIPGISSAAHLEENVAASGLRLSEEDVRRLSRM
jgi:pyridoxine 4-dehydrogenase